MPQAAVGTPAFSMMLLAKDLLPSSCAHHLSGPKQRIPAACLASVSTEGQRQFRTGNHEVHALFSGEGHKALYISVLQGNIFAFGRGSAVSGRAVNRFGLAARAGFSTTGRAPALRSR